MKKVKCLIIAAALTITLSLAATTQVQARSIWSIIWDVWFNPDKEWTSEPPK